MIKGEREARILSILSESGVTSIRDLSLRLSVPAVTLRRDVARLARDGAIRRMHGGAARLERAAPQPHAADALLPLGDGLDAHVGDVDAIVLPPLEGRGAETLRLIARRRRIPFLAESSPQAGAAYLGPDNMAAGVDLGRMAGAGLKAKSARILIVSLEALPNTRERSDGFLKGFAEAFKGDIRHWRVDGEGAFKTALRASLDAMQAHPDINVVFGVNDHSVLAAIEASDRLRLKNVRAFSVGGEGGALLDALNEGRKLVACCALFPEIVGHRAVDVLAGALAGAAMPAEVRTPYAILTTATLGDFYIRDDSGWSLRPEAAARILGTIGPAAPAPAARGLTIGFVPHYPAHDWYRNMRRAMQRRADELGLNLVVAAPESGIAREIRTIRKVIAHAAAERIEPGDTILINAGEVSLFLAEELREAKNITVVTNSLDVLELLSGRPGLKVILTSGEYQAKDRCLVGPSLGALFDTLRVSKAFLALDGISARFGASSADERLALAAQRFINASREVYVLADHSLIGEEASHRIAPLEAVDHLITDSGSLPADRLALASAGVRITLADEETTEEGWPGRPAAPLASPRKAGKIAKSEGRKFHA